MPTPATLQDVAEKAGVHRSTVSLALRDHPRISEAVRKQVQKIAREVGYRSNPLVTALMRSRRTKQAPKHVVLAYVTNYPTRYGWRPPQHDRPDYFPGASARASELGYKLEHFWLAEPGMTPERFAQILMNRGISGLLIGRLPPGQSEISLPWEHFSAVALGLTLRSPRLHHVSEDAFASAAEVMNQCFAMGCKRIAFAFTEPDDSPNTGDRLLGGYLRHQLRLAPEHRLPVLYFKPGEDFGKTFLDWMDTNRPDAVLVTHTEPVMEFYRRAGREFPKRTRLIALVNDKLAHGHPGTHQDPDEIGALAVDMLVGMMHRGETGVPHTAHYVLIPGRWVSGAAAPEDKKKR